MVEKLSFEEREADPGALEAAREVTSRVRPSGTRMLTAIAALALGAWGLLLAVDNAYESYVLYPEMEREMLLPAIILVVFANSLVTCLWGIMLLTRSANSQPSSIRVKQLKSLGKNRLVLGRILVLSGIGGLLVTGYAAAVAIWWRLLLPWTDMDPLLPYAIIDVLITSICACWLGVGFVRRKLSFE